MTGFDAPRDASLDGVKEQLRAQAAMRRSLSVPADEQRRQFDQRFGAMPVPAGCVIKPIRNGEQITPTCGTNGKAVLFHHGGGFSVGSIRSHRHLAARLAEAFGIVVFSMNYRLAPEHPFPAALDDVLANYDTVQQAGFAPADLVLAGESAGGNLTAAALLRLRDEGRTLPAGAYLLSPWLDLELTGASYDDNDDPLFNRADLEQAARAYAGATPRSNPLVPPLPGPPPAGDLAGLPPLLIQVADDEILRSDAERFAARATQAGVEVTLQRWPHAVHAWPFLHPLLPLAAQAAIDEAAAWVRPTLNA